MMIANVNFYQADNAETRKQIESPQFAFLFIDIRFYFIASTS
jgi:hypothetical protein